MTPAAVRELVLEQAARTLTAAGRQFFAGEQDELEDVTANLVTLANEIR